MSVIVQAAKSRSAVALFSDAMPDVRVLCACSGVGPLRRRGAERGSGFLDIRVGDGRC